MHDPEARISTPLARAALEQVWNPVVVLRAIRNPEGGVIDFEYVEANSLACQLNAVPYELLIGARLLDLLPSHEADGLFNLYAGVVDSGVSLELKDMAFDAEVIDGTVHRIDLRATPVGDRLVVAWRDVTEVSRAREQLETAEALRRHSLEVLFDPHVVLQAIRDAYGDVVDFQVIDANTPATRLIDLSVSDVRDATVRDLFEGRWDRDLIDGLVRSGAEAIATGQGSVLSAFEVRGPGVSQRMVMDVGLAPLGERVTVAWRDVTAAFDARELLTRSEARFRALVENTLDVIFDIDTDGRIRWASPSVQSVLGWSPPELVGRFGLGLVHPEESYVADGILKQFLEGASTVRANMRYQRADGSYSWTTGVASMARRTDGSPDGIVVSFRVIDELVAERDRATEDVELLQRIVGVTVDSMAVLTVSRDQEGSLAFVIDAMNESALAHTHLAEADVIGRPMGDVVPEAAATRLRTIATQAFETGVPVTERGMPLIPSTAPESDLLFDVAAIRVDDRVALTWRDVTERLRAEAELAASERQFRLLADHSGDVVVLSDAETRMWWVSPSSAATLGWEPDELVGGKGTDFIHPDDLLRVHRVVETSESTGEAALVRYRWRRPDGSFRWVESAGQPFIDSDGQHRRVVRLRDVHEQVKAEQELSRKEAQFRLLAENASDLVYQTDVSGNIVWVSPSVTAMLGWRPEDLVGKPSTEFVFPEDLPRVSAIRPGLYAGGDITALTIRVLTSTGQPLWVSLSARAIREPLGPTQGVIASIRDISTLVLATQQAEVAARRLRATTDSMLDPLVTLTSVRDDSGTITDFVYVDANHAARLVLARHALIVTDLSVRQTSRGAVIGDLIERLAHTVETGEPTVLDNWEYHLESELQPRWFDIAATRLGDGVSMSWRDVSERFVTARALAESEERLRLVLDNVTDVVFRERHGVVEWVSPSVTHALGGSLEDYLGVDMTTWVHPDDLPVIGEVEQMMAVRGSAVRRLRLAGPSGQYHWFEVHASPYRDSAGAEGGTIAALRNVDAQVAAEDELKRQARWDALTGLMNRGEVMRRLEQAMTPGRRTGGGLALAFCDLDDFKTVNDTHGHAIGDALLEAVASRVRSSVRDLDMVARMGGDEVLVVLDGIHALDDAVAVAEKVRSSVAEPILTDAVTLTATMSIGVTVIRPEETVDEAMARADSAMYEAKRAGRNRVVAFE